MKQTKDDRFHNVAIGPSFVHVFVDEIIATKKEREKFIVKYST